MHAVEPRVVEAPDERCLRLTTGPLAINTVDPAHRAIDAVNGADNAALVHNIITSARLVSCVCLFWLMHGHLPFRMPLCFTGTKPEEMRAALVLDILNLANRAQPLLANFDCNQTVNPSAVVAFAVFRVLPVFAVALLVPGS
jgi:hypothetical protein